MFSIVFDAADVRCGALKTANINRSQIEAANTVADLLALDVEEIDTVEVPTYTRLALENIDITKDTANNIIIISADRPQWDVPDISAWAGQFYFIEDVNDSARQLIAVDVALFPIQSDDTQNVLGPTPLWHLGHSQLLY